MRPRPLSRYLRCATRCQVFCNRTCIERTYLERGIGYVAQMALQNCRDLEPILWWNYDHGIRLFRHAPTP